VRLDSSPARNIEATPSHAHTEGHFIPQNSLCNTNHPRGSSQRTQNDQQRRQGIEQNRHRHSACRRASSVDDAIMRRSNGTVEELFDNHLLGECRRTGRRCTGRVVATSADVGHRVDQALWGPSRAIRESDPSNARPDTNRRGGKSRFTAPKMKRRAVDDRCRDAPGPERSVCKWTAAFCRWCRTATRAR